MFLSLRVVCSDWDCSLANVKSCLIKADLCSHEADANSYFTLSLNFQMLLGKYIFENLALIQICWNWNILTSKWMTFWYRAGTLWPPAFSISGQCNKSLPLTNPAPVLEVYPRSNVRQALRYALWHLGKELVFIELERGLNLELQMRAIYLLWWPHLAHNQSLN